MDNHYQIFPVGTIKKQDRSVFVEIYKEYEDALFGLDQYSHMIVFTWFHENDVPEKRKVLKVHPRGNKANPLTGVFATRSPMRPNLIGLFLCKIISIENNVIQIEHIEAFAGSPVIDIKPYIPRIDSI
jgi:tRNA-Thr(GGU) m(6)t(6)A37 methyltransferase TsaA